MEAAVVRVGPSSNFRGNSGNALLTWGDASRADSAMACSVIECLGMEWDRENFTDFTVRVGGRHFKCHKFILSACSKFFAALLRSDMQEKATGTATVEGMTADTFRLILDAIYKGQSILTINNMLEVWQGAHQLQIEFLIKASEDFVMKQISVGNYMDIYQVANLFQSEIVTGAVHNMMASNFSEIMCSESFPELPPDGLASVVSSKSLAVQKDFAVAAILAWVRGESIVQPTYPQNNWGYPMQKANLQNYYLQNYGVQEGRSQRHGFPTGINWSKGPAPQAQAWRKRHLAQLLQAVNLEEASNECISHLMRDEVVGACGAALRAVSQIGANRLCPR